MEKVESFIREARAEGNGSDSEVSGGGGGGGARHGAAEQPPLELQVLYDDSWLDEMACGLFLVIALGLMTRPYVEVRAGTVSGYVHGADRSCAKWEYSSIWNVARLSRLST